MGRRGDEIHTSHQSLHPTITLYPLHSWGLDFIGPTNPPFEGCIWILVANELFTKWVEAVAMKKATGGSVANFLRENIICCFGVPSRFIFDNDTPFLNKDVRCLTKWYSIAHMAWTPYYPKGDGQAKASNKIMLKILGKMIKENGKGWR